MPQVQASRLSGRGKLGLLADKFPPGSLKRKLAFYVALPLLILFVLYIVVDDIVMPGVTRHGSEFALPDFTDQPLAEAQLTINEMNLGSEISSEQYSPDKDKGIILNQFPIAGTKVKTGRIVKFVVSMGKKMMPIPNLAGLSVRQAILNLETAGLELGEIAWAFSDTLPEKVVVFSYPAANTEIALGSPVNLMVNRGRASDFTYMPKVIGLNITEARKRLEDKSLKAGIITYRADDNFLPETVLEQSEPEGAELDIGTEIDLVVSTSG